MITAYLVSYNYAEFLEASIQGILNQKGQVDAELFLVNDGSSDNTSDVYDVYYEKLKKIFSRVTIIENHVRQGLFACANQVLRRSEGTHLVRIDADDAVSSMFFANLSQLIHEGYDFVVANYHYVDEDMKYVATETKYQDLEISLNPNDPPHGAFTLWPIEKLREVGGYPSNGKGRDGLAITLLLQKFRLRGYGLALPIFSYRQHSNSLSSPWNNYSPHNGRWIKAGLSNREDHFVSNRLTQKVILFSIGGLIVPNWPDDKILAAINLWINQIISLDLPVMTDQEWKVVLYVPTVFKQLYDQLKNDVRFKLIVVDRSENYDTRHEGKYILDQILLVNAELGNMLNNAFLICPSLIIDPVDREDLEHGLLQLIASEQDVLISCHPSDDIIYRKSGERAIRLTKGGSQSRYIEREHLLIKNNDLIAFNGLASVEPSLVPKDVVYMVSR